MPALTDPRPQVHAQRRIEVWEIDAIAPATAAELVTSLLTEWPDVDLPTIRVTLKGSGENDRFVCVDARRGTITGEPKCDCYPSGFSPSTYEGPQHHCRVHGHGPDCCESCHTVAGHPHTEYCQVVADVAEGKLTGAGAGLPDPFAGPDSDLEHYRS